MRQSAGSGLARGPIVTPSHTDKDEGHEFAIISGETTYLAVAVRVDVVGVGVPDPEGPTRAGRTGPEEFPEF